METENGGKLIATELLEYKSSLGLFCPNCGSQNLTWSDLDWTDSGSEGTISCDNCDLEWTETHITTEVTIHERKSNEHKEQEEWHSPCE